MKNQYVKNALICIIILAFVGIKIRDIDRWVLILITDPPPPLMIKKMDEQYECVRKAGFAIKKPTLRLIKSAYVPDTPRGFAYDYYKYGVITLFDFSSYQTLAHEMGHIIDYQTKRKGHLFFQGKENWDIEVFADAVKAVILTECNGWSKS